ncbi:MAG: InlB B-repeat-containing protein [Propionibacteriaceae bacterium]|nr:InlB B-repeat-containing protein [Propionibacteriaceae bacterium]
MDDAQASAYSAKTLDALNARTGAGTSYPSNGVVAKGATVVIDCWVYGESVNGDTYWDHITSPIGGYVSDWYVDLNNANPKDRGISQCGTPNSTSSGNTNTAPATSATTGSLTAAQQKIVDVAKNSASYGIPAQAGMCAKWVADVYSAAGQAYPWGNAIDFWTQWKSSGSSSSSNIPVGAAIITSGTSAQYGHIGIYLGSNQVISNVGGTRIESLSSFISWATAKNTTTGTSGFIGWVWPNGNALGSATSGTANTSGSSGTVASYTAKTLDALNARTGAGTSYPSVGVVAKGATVVIDCYVVGEPINSDSYWDHITSPYSGYVSDWYVDLGNANPPDRNIKLCGNSPSTGGSASLNADGTYSAKTLDALTVRKGATTGFDSIGVVSKGATVKIKCWVVGEEVQGDMYWDHITSPYDGYVSDYYVDLGNANPSAKGIPLCGGDRMSSGATNVTPSTLGTTAVTWAQGIANDNSHGYSQTTRWGPSYDCSSLVIQAWETAGVKVRSAGATYTGNMLSIFQAKGFKQVAVNLTTGAGLQVGDVLLNAAHHTAMVASVSGGVKIVQASDDYDGKAGDSGGKEIWTTTYKDYPWEYVLRYPQQAPATYTITYDANGGSGAPAPQTKTSGKALTLSSAKPTRATYTFLGWSTSSTATGGDSAYAPGKSYTQDKSITLYAIWAVNYVALGDSFSSGDGAGDYEQTTITNNIWPYEPVVDHQYQVNHPCYRSAHAYAYQLANDSASRASLTAFVACQGAVIGNITGSYKVGPGWRDGPEKSPTLTVPPQLDSVTANTGLITISIGGNDAGFAGLIQDCILNVSWPGCVSGSGPFTNIKLDSDGDGKADISRADFVAKKLQSRLETVYKTILDKAPSARMYVLNYPLVPPGPSGPNGTFAAMCGALGRVAGGFTDVETGVKYADRKADVSKALYDFEIQLNSTIQKAVTAVNNSIASNGSAKYKNRIYLVDVNVAGLVNAAGVNKSYVGHGLCDKPSYFNGLGEGEAFLTSSYHPTADGQEADYLALKKVYTVKK